MKDSESELDKISLAATEENIEPPNELAVSTAHLVLQHLAQFENLPEPNVYPTDNQTVAIYFTKSRSFVLVHCESTGETVCFSTISGKRVRVRFEDGSELLESFLDDQLKKLIKA